MNKFLDIDFALECVRTECEDINVYLTLKDVIENLEQEVEGLNIELEALESTPRYHRAREEDWQ
jgi:hypothetical protein